MNLLRNADDFVAADVEKVEIRQLDDRRHVDDAATTAFEGFEVLEVDEGLKVVDIPVEGEIQLDEMIAGNFDEAEGDREFEEVLVGEGERLFALGFTASQTVHQRRQRPSEIEEIGLLHQCKGICCIFSLTAW